MKMLSEEIAVNTGAPVEILRFNASELLNVTLQAVGALRIGMSSVSSTHGFTLAAGSAIAYNRVDFPTNKGDYEVVLYAAAGANTTIGVAGFFLE